MARIACALKSASHPGTGLVRNFHTRLAGEAIRNPPCPSKGSQGGCDCIGQHRASALRSRMLDFCHRCTLRTSVGLHLGEAEQTATITDVRAASAAVPLPPLSLLASLWLPTSPRFPPAWVRPTTNSKRVAAARVRSPRVASRIVRALIDASGPHAAIVLPAGHATTGARGVWSRSIDLLWRSA